VGATAVGAWSLSADVQAHEEEIMNVLSQARWRGKLVVDTHADYSAVERAVDLLSDWGFPVETGSRCAPLAVCRHRCQRDLGNP
jgi:hypothetical protein